MTAATRAMIGVALAGAAVLLAGAAAAQDRRALIREAVLCDRLEVFRRALETLAARDYLARPQYPADACRSLPAGAQVAGPFDRRRLTVHGVREAFDEDFVLVEHRGRRQWIADRDLGPGAAQ